MKRTTCISLACILAMALIGCASLTVKKVNSDNNHPVAGIQYSLPKPFIQAVPQSDGIVAFSVVYLPDTQNTYATDTSAFMSSYTFQMVLDQNGMLNKLEYKQNTSAVAQQAAATSGAMTAQILNAKNAQLVAMQTAADTAQSQVDEARAARDTAKVKLEALRAQQPRSEDTIKLTEIELAQAEAKLAVKKQVLARVRNDARVISITATSGTPISTSAPTPSTSGFDIPAWSAPTVHNIPGNKGALLFAINEGVDAGKRPFVKLAAAMVDGQKQPSFETRSTAASAAPKQPDLEPKDSSFVASGQAEFTFNGEVVEITRQKLETAPLTETPPPSEVPQAPKAQYDPTTRKVTLPLQSLFTQRYKLTLFYKYRVGPETMDGSAFVYFIVK